MSAAPADQPLSPWWRNAAVLVMVIGFAILSVMTYNTYRHAPPIPARVVDESGSVLFTGDEILRGQEVFLKYGLMEHGTLWGHGAYLGPDYGANYLHRDAEISRDTLAADRYGKRFSELAPLEQEAVAGSVRASLKTNRYDPASSTLTFTKGEAASLRIQQQEWADYFSKKDAAPGLPEPLHRERGRDLPPDLVLRVGRLGVAREPTGEGLLLHEQLPVRAAGRKRPEQRRLPLERAFPGLPPGRARPRPFPVRG